MSAKALRTVVVAKALGDAAKYYGEFHCSVVVGHQDWVMKAWAAVRRDPGLSPSEAIKLWPVYWKALSEETVRLATIRVVGE